MEDEAATCQQCGAIFYRGHNEYWKRLCFECWLENKNNKVTNLNRDLQRNNQILIQENQRLMNQVEVLNREVAKLKNEITKRQQGGVRIPDDIWRFMILCCHPDRHWNSPVSNEATRWLLQFRETAKTE
jgi:hypothetical protein